jgi:hypothetical protein
MSFILQPWHIVLLAVSRNFNDTGADDYLRGTTQFVVSSSSFIAIPLPVVFVFYLILNIIDVVISRTQTNESDTGSH